MQVLIPANPDFNYEECKILFEKNQYLIEDFEKFDDVIKNTFFYSFFEGGKHIGCIYYYELDNKLYVNVVAYRKTHLINIECFKESLTWWNCDIYARTHHKTAIYGILKCGFKKIGENLYRYRRL
jgi:hypothetical protein